MRFRRAPHRGIRSILSLRVGGIRNYFLIRDRIIVSRFLGDIRLLAIQRFAQRGRVNRFLGTRPLFFRRYVDSVVRVVSPMGRLSKGQLRSFFHTLVSRSVASLNRSSRCTHAIFVTRPTLSVGLHRGFVIGPTHLFNAFQWLVCGMFLLRSSFLLRRFCSTFSRFVHTRQFPFKRGAYRVEHDLSRHGNLFGNVHGRTDHFLPTRVFRRRREQRRGQAKVGSVLSNGIQHHSIDDFGSNVSYLMVSIHSQDGSGTTRRNDRLIKCVVSVRIRNDGS